MIYSILDISCSTSPGNTLISQGLDVSCLNAYLPLMIESNNVTISVQVGGALHSNSRIFTRPKDPTLNGISAAIS